MTLAEIEALYRRYGSLVYRRAERILHDAEAARDVQQEVFIAAINDREAFRQKASPATWLYSITTHVSLNRLRNHRLQQSKLALPSAERAGFGQSEPTSPDSMAQLRQALARLPIELGQVAIHFYVDQMSYDEMAEQLKCSRRTVANRLDEFRQRAAELANEVKNE